MGFPLALIPLAISLAAGGAQAYSAAKQRKKASKINPSRPTMGLPSAIKEKTNLAKNMASSSLLPAQAYYENMIGAQTARNVRDIKKAGGSSNEVISALANSDEKSRAQLNSLIAQGAEYQARNKELYGNALSEKADYEMEMFDYNQNQPYQTAMLQKQALIDASNRNYNNALQTVASGASTISTGVAMDQQYGTNYYGFNRPQKYAASNSAIPSSLLSFPTQSRGIGSSSMYSKRSPMGVQYNNGNYFSNQNLGLTPIY